MRITKKVLLAGVGLVLALGCGSVSDPSTEDRNRGGGPPVLSVGPVTPMLDSQKQPVTATLFNGDGFHILWSATGGNVQSETQGQTQVLKYISPEIPGTYTVTAQVAEFPSVTASASVEVRKITVNAQPKTASLSPGGLLFVSAQATGGFPDPAGGSGITWTTSGGTVDANGIFHAPEETGLYVLKAISTKDPRKFDQAVIQVGGDVAVYLTPVEASMKVGESQPFTAIVFGSENKNVYWTATGGALDDKNVYTAKEVGTWKVVVLSAADPSKKGEAQITVNP